ncbi:hypothetical protein HYU11_01650 [Candidatus Woesearchaeota archaeon]|nr:hypothetical protein [Candidatus Woesearchaeota archaeon]
MRERKGALDVSINSIVVIVFAITMLGLGLVFIKERFGQISDIPIGGELKLVPPASASKPISLSNDEFAVQRGKIHTFALKFYNNGLGEVNVDFRMGKCINAETGVDSTTDAFIIRAVPQDIPVANEKEFKIKLAVNGNTLSAEYICTLQAFTSGNNEQITLADQQITLKVK